METSSSSIVVRAPPEKVWDALTKPELVKRYFFGTNLVTDWRVGSPMFFRGEWKGKPYEDRGTVLSFEPVKQLSYSYWSAFFGTEDLPENRQRVGFKLQAVEGGTRLEAETSGPRAQQSGDNWRTVLDGLKAVVEQP